jgi:hypothetical protein
VVAGAVTVSVGVVAVGSVVTVGVVVESDVVVVVVVLVLVLVVVGSPVDGVVSVGAAAGVVLTGADGGSAESCPCRWRPWPADWPPWLLWPPP